MNQQKKVNYMAPFITMVILMGLIGFLTVLNQQFQVPLKAAFLQNAGDLQNTLTTLLTFSFFMAYLVMGMPSAKVVERKGYKYTLVLALIILIVGIAIFELSALYFETFPNSIVTISSAKVPVAYFIFLLGSFTVGAAMTFLQVVVNPYLVACNVKGTSDVQRQSIAGTANSAMTTITPLFVTYVIFSGQKLDSIQIGSIYLPFAALMVVVAVIAIVISRINLPDIAGTTLKSGEKLERSIWSFRHLVLGAVAIFTYVGVEVAVGANINLYAIDLYGASFAEKATLMASLYWGGLLLGRFISSFLSRVPANIQLGVGAVAAMILVAIAMATANPWVLVGVGFFHSVMWPSIFALGVRGLGKYTAAGSGAMIVGICGGAILPFIQGIVADMSGWGVTWWIVIAGEIYLLYYALRGSKIRAKDNMTEL